MLESKNINCAENDTFLEYISAWLNKVDKGGLYHISDMCFEMFFEIEHSIYEELKDKFDRTSSPSTMEQICTNVCNDPDVSCLWSIRSIDIPSQKRHDVLNDLVREWITLRGHSMTCKFIEQYK